MRRSHRDVPTFSPVLHKSFDRLLHVLCERVKLFSQDTRPQNIQPHGAPILRDDLRGCQLENVETSPTCVSYSNSMTVRADASTMTGQVVLVLARSWYGTVKYLLFCIFLMRLVPPVVTTPSHGFWVMSMSGNSSTPTVTFNGTLGRYKVFVFAAGARCHTAGFFAPLDEPFRLRHRKPRSNRK